MVCLLILLITIQGDAKDDI